MIRIMRSESSHGKKSQSSILNKSNIKGQIKKKNNLKKDPKQKKKIKKLWTKIDKKNKMTRHL